MAPRKHTGFSLRRERGLMVLISIGAAGVLALALSACGSSSTTTTTVTEGSASGGAAEEGEESATGSGAKQNVKLVVKSDEEHGKKGPDGNWHDAFLPANFTVKAGATVHVTVYNYDDAPHSFTSTELGTNEVIPGGEEGEPSKTTFTFQAPSKQGSYEWHCAIPCDEWAMDHFGYMKGHVNVS